MGPTKAEASFEERQMAVDKSLIGTPTGRSKITVERGPVSNFAKALKDENPIYLNPEAAKAAGFENIPAPPTSALALAHWAALAAHPPAAAPQVRTPALGG